MSNGSIRVGINGLGVMGRYLMRALQEELLSGQLGDKKIEVVAVNDLFPVEQLVPLVAHDSVYLRFPGRVETDGRDMLIDGRRISVSAERDPSKLNWADRGVDIVYESTGAFVKKPGVEDHVKKPCVEDHLKAGASKVIISAPSDLAEKTIVMGVNSIDYTGEKIISNASCTTNCLAPLALALYDAFGEYTGLMTTIHAYTADQRLVDAPHKDVARAYAAGLNFIPTSTGAAKAIGKVIPALDGRLNGFCIRGPVAVGSIVDLVADLSEAVANPDIELTEVAKEAVNEAIKQAASGGLKGTLEYRDGPVVSSMVLGCPVPSVFDASQTMAAGNLVKVIAHYDNVAGYSHQAVRLIRMIGSYQPTR